eukprot:CAMPEP_0171135470 /NCGR_PEP_ID=MMETSP0766_2-20121228/129853_1 /TAXON_ID=439317 /ORGANISM="Gambierdiscus australes, Strain CAWD 149" /LENGTH=148 /DNA_ID=CAMNT_0011598971 /DNA_START=117 /DNA_END=561 /DNA_ORIENTATION=+
MTSRRRPRDTLPATRCAAPRGTEPQQAGKQPRGEHPKGEPLCTDGHGVALRAQHKSSWRKGKLEEDHEDAQQCKAQLRIRGHREPSKAERHTQAARQHTWPPANHVEEGGSREGAKELGKAHSDRAHVLLCERIDLEACQDRGSVVHY